MKKYISLHKLVKRELIAELWEVVEMIENTVEEVQKPRNQRYSLKELLSDLSKRVKTIETKYEKID